MTETSISTFQIIIERETTLGKGAVHSPSSPLLPIMYQSQINGLFLTKQQSAKSTVERKKIRSFM